jgi:aminodeoxyfutalosine deaminase
MVDVFRARWVLPIAQPPIHDGWVAVQDGRIAEVGEGRGPAGGDDLGNVAILPGLVNAHTHLELSYLHGRIPPTWSFTPWVRDVIRMRLEYPDPSHPDILAAARRAIDDARAAGTSLFGDISNTLATVPLLRDAGIPARVFYELIGFSEVDHDARVRDARARVEASDYGDPSIRISLAPHATYSVSAAMFRAIRADLDRHPDDVSSVHLGEASEEGELLRDGRGQIRDLLQSIGRWPEGWRPPGVAPVPYLADLGVLDARTLVVHGVQFDESDLRRLKSLGATIVSCPRSNVYVGVGSPPLDAFYNARVPVAFGTDSLASVADLNLFAELREARRIAPRVTARRLLESATLVAARALGFGNEFGSIEPGKRADLIAVEIGDDATDVEEYLVSGIQPSDVSWL